MHSQMINERPSELQGYVSVKILEFLRVVQTQAILFLKSMSERGGFDIERLWNLKDNSYLYRLKNLESRSIDYDGIEI